MKLQLGGHLPFYAFKRQAKLEVQLKQPARLKDVISQIGIPVAEVYMTVVNGELVTLDETTVSDEDDVRLYSPMDGG
jgi:sulfur carrier protein ThiS